MARNVTVQQIVDQIQILCQDPDHALATEAQYVQFVSDEYSQLYAMYVDAEPDRFRTEATITSTANTAAYSLPADWYSTVAVDFTSGSVREPLDRLQEQDRNRYVNGLGDCRAYRIIGTNVVLYPTPTTSGQTFTHVYLPTAPAISSVGTTLDLRIGHERYLQLCVARLLLNSENTYDGRWDDEINLTRATLKMQANQRYFLDMARMKHESWVRGRNWPWTWPYGARW